MSALTFTHRIAHGLRHRGLRWLVSAAVNRLVPPYVAMKPDVLAVTAAREGLEIGGPSPIFAARGILPVYPRVARIDNVNFSAESIWEKNLRDGSEFHYSAGRPTGTQWIRDAVKLTGLANESYDFVLSSHCLEHVANPLGALVEWRRVTRPGGHLILTLPNPKNTFDHRRPITSLSHLLEDQARNRSESDDTHFAEVLSLHDLARDPGAGRPNAFRNRVRHNAEVRGVHHHVFDLLLMQEALWASGWNVVATEMVLPLQLVALAQKSAV